MMELSCNILVFVRWFWLFLIHATLLISPSVELVMINDSANTTDALALLAFKQQIRRDPVHPLRTWNDSLPVARNHMRLTPSSQYCGYESGWASIGRSFVTFHSEPYIPSYNRP